MITRRGFIKLLGLGSIGFVGIGCGLFGYVSQEEAEEMARDAADSAVKTVIASNSSPTSFDTIISTDTPTLITTDTPSPTPSHTPTVTPLPTESSYYWWYYYQPPPPPPPKKSNKNDDCPPGNHCNYYWEKVKRTPTPSRTPRHPHHP